MAYRRVTKLTQITDSFLESVQKERQRRERGSVHTVSPPKLTNQGGLIFVEVRSPAGHGWVPQSGCYKDKIKVSARLSSHGEALDKNLLLSSFLG